MFQILGGLAVFCLWAEPAAARHMWAYFTGAERASIVEAVREEGGDPAPLIAGFRRIPQPVVPGIQAAAVGPITAHLVSAGLCSAPVVTPLGKPAALMNDRIVGMLVQQQKASRGFLVEADVTDCGGADRASVIVLEGAGGGYRPVLPLPGGTESWLTLRRDLLQAVVMHVSAKLSDVCPEERMAESMRVLSTDVESRDGLGERIFGSYLTGSWTERWRVSVCERNFDFRMFLDADGEGGARYRMREMDAE